MNLSLKKYLFSDPWFSWQKINIKYNIIWAYYTNYIRLQNLQNNSIIIHTSHV